MAVGSPGSSNSIGNVFVFSQSSNGTWASAQRLVPSVPSGQRAVPNEQFGSQVALANFANVLVVATNPIIANPLRAVYVFQRPNTQGGTWSQMSRLSNPHVVGGLTNVSPRGGGSFGASIAVLPNGQAIFIGQPGRLGGSSGIVNVYRTSNRAWVWVSSIQALNPSSGDLFGFSMAATITSSLMGTGGNTLVVGAPGARLVFVCNPSVGGEYVVTQTLANPASTATRTPTRAPTAGNNLGFGIAVAVAGQFIAVTNPGLRGSVVLFSRGSGWSSNWQFTQRLNVMSQSSDFNFGQNLTMTPSVLAVSCSVASGTSRQPNTAGNIYIFNMPSGFRSPTARTFPGWSQNQRLVGASVTSPQAAGPSFGASSVALNGVNLAVGVGAQNAGGVNGTGGVYLFTGSGIIIPTAFPTRSPTRSPTYVPGRPTPFPSKRPSRSPTRSPTFSRGTPTMKPTSAIPVSIQVTQVINGLTPYNFLMGGGWGSSGAYPQSIALAVRDVTTTFAPPGSPSSLMTSKAVYVVSVVAATPDPDYKMKGYNSGRRLGGCRRLQEEFFGKDESASSTFVGRAYDTLIEPVLDIADAVQYHVQRRLGGGGGKGAVCRPPAMQVTYTINMDANAAKNQRGGFGALAYKDPKTAYNTISAMLTTAITNGNFEKRMKVYARGTYATYLALNTTKVSRTQWSMINLLTVTAAPPPVTDTTTVGMLVFAIVVVAIVAFIGILWVYTLTIAEVEVKNLPVDFSPSELSKTFHKAHKIFKCASQEGARGGVALLVFENNYYAKKLMEKWNREVEFYYQNDPHGGPLTNLRLNWNGLRLMGPRLYDPNETNPDMVWVNPESQDKDDDEVGFGGAELVHTINTHVEKL